MRKLKYKLMTLTSLLTLMSSPTAGFTGETCAFLKYYIAEAKAEKNNGLIHSAKSPSDTCSRAHRLQDRLRAELRIIDADAQHCGCRQEKIIKMHKADDNFYYSFMPGC